MPGEIVLFGEGILALLPLAQGGGVILGNEGARLGAESDVFSREIEINDVSP